MADKSMALGDADLPAGPAHLLKTPETCAQEHAGPHDGVRAETERKEVDGLRAAGTRVEKNGTQRGFNIVLF